MNSNNRDSFWPSYVDIMTTLFAIMLILFAVSFTRFRLKEKQLLEKTAELEEKTWELQDKTDKYNSLCQMYSIVENIDTAYFQYDAEYIKNIFRINVTYERGEFKLNKLEEDRYDKGAADSIRNELKHAGSVILQTIRNLRESNSSNQNVKFLVVIEGQASADGYHINDYFNNDVLSYQRALELHKFWRDSAQIDFTKIDKCELVICGSGEGGVPRNADDERFNQRFLIHIVPVIGSMGSGL